MNVFALQHGREYPHCHFFENIPDSPNCIFHSIASSSSHKNKINGSGGGGGGVGHSSIVETNENSNIMSTNEQIRLISGGRWFYFFITDKNTIYTCGFNGAGQLSTGDLENVEQPILMKTFENIKIAYACGGFVHAIYLAEDGRVFGCGSNANGQLTFGRNRSAAAANSTSTVMTPPGNGTTSPPSMFYTALQIDPRVFHNERVIRIQSGGHHCLFYTDKHHLFSAGCNDSGECGVPSSASSSSFFICPEYGFAHQVPLPFSEPIVDIKCGYQHSVLLTANGQVYSFGHNNANELGLPHSQVAYTPCKVQIPERVIQISCGFYFSMFKTENDLYVAGNNNSRQLGLPQTRNHELQKSSLEQLFPDLFKGSRIKSISCAAYHSILVSDNFSMYRMSSESDPMELTFADRELANTFLRNGCQPAIFMNEFVALVYFPKNSSSVISDHFHNKLLPSSPKFNDVSVVCATRIEP